MCFKLTWTISFEMIILFHSRFIAYLYLFLVVELNKRFYRCRKCFISHVSFKLFCWRIIPIQWCKFRLLLWLTTLTYSIICCQEFYKQKPIEKNPKRLISGAKKGIHRQQHASATHQPLTREYSGELIRGVDVALPFQDVKSLFDGLFIAREQFLILRVFRFLR